MAATGARLSPNIWHEAMAGMSWYSLNWCSIPACLSKTQRPLGCWEKVIRRKRAISNKKKCLCHDPRDAPSYVSRGTKWFTGRASRMDPGNILHYEWLWRECRELLHQRRGAYERFSILAHKDGSIVLYAVYHILHANARTWIGEKIKEWTGASSVPAGFAIFAKDGGNTPREWAERFFNVQRWTTIPEGGHFAALEEPKFLANELMEFFRPFR